MKHAFIEQRVLATESKRTARFLANLQDLPVFAFHQLQFARSPPNRAILSDSFGKVNKKSPDSETNQRAVTLFVMEIISGAQYSMKTTVNLKLGNQNLITASKICISIQLRLQANR